MAVVNPTKHLTDIYEWHKMGAAGVFSENNHIELIDGEILDMAPIGFNHAGHLNRLTHLFSMLVSDKAILSIQNPVQLSRFSEPEPDIMLLKPNADFYCTRHPNADDVLLLIEVSDTTLNYDQNKKLHLYARHNIPEYWILNLNDNCLEVYRKPHREVYGEKTTLQSSDNIVLSQLPYINIEVSAIL
jgi:Uma2 family endonuclease